MLIEALLIGKNCVYLIRGKYLSLFPAPVQEKVFNLEVFGEKFWEVKARKRKKIRIFSRLLVNNLKRIAIYEKIPTTVC